jgi:V8-like Glu-specific endopeptidase
MAERVITSGHTPVSNVPEDPDFPPVARTEVVEPEMGEAVERAAPREAAESIEGARYVPRGPETLTAPDMSALPDIGVASFGPPPPLAETVHGFDDRRQIHTTAEYPWRVNCALLITARDNSRWIGTAWFISPRTLITAGHVVYIKGSPVPGRNGWVSSITVIPGQNGSQMPFGSATSTDFRTVSGWSQNGDENYDYGAIILPTELGKQTGWYGFGKYTDDELEGVIGNVSGYPGDKPSGTQWFDTRAIARVNNRKVFYDIDTAGGQSGSAVYQTIDGKRYAIAIHAYGGASVNSGTRINTPVYNNLVTWKT